MQYARELYKGGKSLVEVTKQEMELLIEKGYLRCVAGKYEGLVVTSKRKKGNGKSRMIQEDIADKLRYCK